MPKSRKNLPGYTFVEILVVIAIIAIVSSIILTELNSHRVQKQVGTSASEVVAVVREAQGYALTGRQMVANSEPCSYQVSWSGSTYNLIYNYKSGSDCSATASQSSSYTLRDGVGFTGSGTVSFRPPHATPSFGTSSLGITVGKNGTTRIVCVFVDGLVKEGTTCP